LKSWVLSQEDRRLLPELVRPSWREKKKYITSCKKEIFYPSLDPHPSTLQKFEVPNNVSKPPRVHKVPRNLKLST
jgi:hypothetical protein